MKLSIAITLITASLLLAGCGTSGTCGPAKGPWRAKGMPNHQRPIFTPQHQSKTQSKKKISAKPAAKKSVTAMVQVPKIKVVAEGTAGETHLASNHHQK